MKQRLRKVIIIYIGLLLIFIAYYIINKKTGFYIPCIFHEITGLDCPGCGITRCLFYLINLNIIDAFKVNPLVFILLPFIIAYFIYQSYLYVYNKKDQILVKIPNYIMYTLLFITIVYGIIRNII